MKKLIVIKSVFLMLMLTVLSLTFSQSVLVTALQSNSEINHNLQDLGFRACVTEKINIPLNADISEKQLESIDGELNCSNRQIKSIDGVESLKNVKSLNFSNNFITDITLLESLKQIVDLNLSNNNIFDFKALKHTNSKVNVEHQNADLGRLVQGTSIEFESLKFLENEIDITTSGAEVVKDRVTFTNLGKGQVTIKNKNKGILNLTYEVVNKQTPKCGSSNFGEIVQPNSVQFKDIDIEKYCIFSNKDVAVKNLSKKYQIELQKYNINLDLVLKSSNPLETFKFETNKLYQKKKWTTIKLSQMKVKDYIDYKKFMDIENEILSFFDIYENTEENTKIDKALEDLNSKVEKNKEIKKTNSIDQHKSENNFSQMSLYKSKESNSGSVSDVLKAEMELYLLVPNTNTSLENDIKTNTEIQSMYNVETSKKVNKVNKSFNFEKYGVGSFDEMKAIDYAMKYAEKPNTSDLRFEYYDGKDCTNFVSQILLAGGKQTSFSWMHGSIPHGKKPTRAWVNANEFVKLHGINKTWTVFESLKLTAINKDVVGFDNTGDGQWDHLGYVLAKNAWKDGTHPTIMIAQHSNNYMKWDYETSWSKAAGARGQYVMVAR